MLRMGSLGRSSCPCSPAKFLDFLEAALVYFSAVSGSESASEVCPDAGAADTGSALPPGPALSPGEVSFQWLARPYAFLDECAARFGDAFTLGFARFGTHVVVSHPDDVRDVLSLEADAARAGRGNAVLEPVLGPHSLLLLDGDRHLAQRAVLQPAFRTGRVEAYAPAVAAAVRRHTDAWGDGTRVGLHRTALEISQEVILRAVFGVCEDELERFGRLVSDVMALVSLNAPLDAASSATRLHARFAAAREALHAALQEHIERRRQGAGDPAGDLPGNLAGNPGDVLALLLRAQTEGGAPLTDADIRDQLLTMVLAGHETTASAITWTVLAVQAAPPVHERLCRELDGTAADWPAQGLAGLPYLNATCLEALRLRPVIPVISRELTGSLRLRGGVVPPGVFVTPCAYLAHRRPEVFPEPDVFRPERFLDQRFSPFTFFPFGGGVRRCIGMGFALLEMQIAVGALLRAFDFTPVGAPPRPVRRAVTIVPSGGAQVVVRRRTAADRIWH
jgi:cytochrome P450 family 110